MHRHDVDFAAREHLLELLLRAHDRAFAVVADHFGRAGGDHGDDAQVRIALGQHDEAFLDAHMAAEHGRVLVQRRRGDVEVLLEVLGEQEPHEHGAALAAMDQRNAVLDADAGILGAGRLAIVYRVDDADPILADDFTTHGGNLRK